MSDASSTLRTRARRLRRDQTDAERKLWIRLRARQVSGAKFRRQQPIGHHIVDFCCMEQKVVIELDGGHHTLQAQADQRRTDILAQRGYRVLRFWDHEVLTDPDAVLQQIAIVVSHPHPDPLPEGRGGNLETEA